MRKLITADVFATARIIKASGMREELKQLIKRAVNSGESAENIGIEGFLVIAEALAEKNSENAIYAALAGPFEMSAEDVAALPLDELMANLAELVQSCNVSNFFKNVSGILGKN